MSLFHDGEPFGHTEILCETTRKRQTTSPTMQLKSMFAHQIKQSGRFIAYVYTILFYL